MEEEQLLPMLDDFKKYYVFYHKNPEYDEYRQHYENIKNNLDKFDRQIDKSISDTIVATDSLNTQLAEVNIKIQRERARNTVILRRLHMAENQSNGSDEMIHDYTSIYDAKYTRNWGLIIGAVIFIISSIV